MEFEKALNGIYKYLDNEIYGGMADWQEVLARIAVSRMIGNSEELKKTLTENPLARTLAIIDEQGNVDVDGLMRDLKEQIRQKGKMCIAFPIFGKFTFVEADVDRLHRTMMEG